MTFRRVPLSLTDLKRQRSDQKSLDSRPQFLSKSERQRAALDRLSARRKQQSHAQATRPTLTSSSLNSSHLHQPSLKRPRTPPSPTPAHNNPALLSSLRQHYMNQPPPRKQTKSVKTKPSGDKGRFQFDWDEQDDTLGEDDDFRAAIRRQTAHALQFGRGRLAGMSDMWASAKPSEKTAYLRDGRHWSDKTRAEMTDRDWRIFREDFRMSIRSSHRGHVPNPARTWDETGLPRQMLTLVRRVGYEAPSPIQMSAIPVGLADRDCIGLAETGSGKTAAFVLPMVVHVMGRPKMTPTVAMSGPYALVLAPTRELALQIEAEARKFAAPMGFRIVCVIGGQGWEEQVGQLAEGCEIIVCTPGRMVDLLGRQMAVLGNCQYLILDEADRMVDMGFEPQLRQILDAMPESTDRLTFMFSATMSPAVERIAKGYLRDPIIVSVGETGKTADNVHQRVEYFISENRRRDRFIQLLETLESPILVFVNTKSGCEMVSRFVEANSSVRPYIMHSGKSQAQREKILDGFKTGRYKVLIATDVVGRGIDIKGIRNVINFELPKTIESYTHRIGRTGRAGEKGTAWSLATEADAELFGPLCQLLEKVGSHIPQEIAKEGANRGGRGFRPITD